MVSFFKMISSFFIRILILLFFMFFFRDWVRGWDFGEWLEAQRPSPRDSSISHLFLLWLPKQLFIPTLVTRFVIFLILMPYNYYLWDFSLFTLTPRLFFHCKGPGWKVFKQGYHCQLWLKVSTISHSQTQKNKCVFFFRILNMSSE